jgi:hypothetical protein
MKNIKKSVCKEAIIIEGNGEILILTAGMEIEITTDNTDFEKMVRGTVERVTGNRIQIEGNEDIPYDYIEEIKVL